jgi:hypothetical protein
MRRLAFALLFLLASLPAAAEELKIVGISPRYGPPGTAVRIQFESIPSCPILPPSPYVLFGNVPTQSIISGGENAIIVIAPPNAPGTVDLEAWLCGADPGKVTNAFTYTAGVEPFRVLSVKPAFGSVHGGNDVVLQLDQIPACSDPVPPASVTFGNTEGVNAVQDDEAKTITVTTPRHLEGPVDLIVRTCGGAQTFVANGFFFMPEAGVNPGDFEKILIPVAYNGPGARGSQWRTSVSVTNLSERSIDTPEPTFAEVLLGCSAPRSRILARTTTATCGPDHQAGQLVYLRKRFAGDLHFGARIFDTSRGDVNAGTEVPVVRDRDLRDHIVLVNVPIDARFRTSLRVYNPHRFITRVHLRFLHAVDPSIVLGQTDIDLTAPQENGSFPLRPSFHFIDDLAARFPAIAGEGRVQIELTPNELTRSPIWAMASITNNETQMVTVVTPQ